MTALTSDRPTNRRPGHQFVDPVATNVRIFMGSLVVLDASGNAKPGTTATGLIARGVAQETVDNLLGAAGARTVRTEPGCFGLGTDGSITRAHIGKTVYIVDDQTLSATDGSGTRSAAGVLKDLEGSGSTATAWIQVG